MTWIGHMFSYVDIILNDGFHRFRMNNQIFGWIYLWNCCLLNNFAISSFIRMTLFSNKLTFPSHPKVVNKHKHVVTGDIYLRSSDRAGYFFTYYSENFLKIGSWPSRKVYEAILVSSSAFFYPNFYSNQEPKWCLLCISRTVSPHSNNRNDMNMLFWAVEVASLPE